MYYGRYHHVLEMSPKMADELVGTDLTREEMNALILRRIQKSNQANANEKNRLCTTPHVYNIGNHIKVRNKKPALLRGSLFSWEMNIFLNN